MDRDIIPNSQPSTSSMQASLSLNQNTQETHFPNSDHNDIDWLSILSEGSFSLANHNPSPGTTTTTTIARNGDEGENERKSRKGKFSRGNKVLSPPRIAFHTRSADDILDDGYRWRKYGQKSVKNSKHPRSYYRCTHHTCNVKKQIQRLSKDSSIVVTTYEGIHNHPCEKLMELLGPLIKQMQFFSRI